MPNIEILSKIDRSPLLAAIQGSNAKKIEREACRRAAGHTLAATTKSKDVNPPARKAG
jgi:hypothetical protein